MLDRRFCRLIADGVGALVVGFMSWAIAAALDWFAARALLIFGVFVLVLGCVYFWEISEPRRIGEWTAMFAISFAAALSFGWLDCGLDLTPKDCLNQAHGFTIFFEVGAFLYAIASVGGFVRECTLRGLGHK